MNTITREEAVKAGFRPITAPYSPTEARMLEAAVRQLAGCKVIVVTEPAGSTIWRAAQEVSGEDNDYDL
jgi:hypothetical protein